jgi:TRAP-type C4-dicarboxylate transport system substrate-binding protein
MAKKTGLLILLIATLGVFAGFTQAADEKPQAAAIKLTYANFPPAATFPCVQMERWKTEVEKRTGGKIAVQTFPGESLLSAKEMIDGVINGQADIGCLCMAYQPGRFPVTNATALPLEIPSSKVGSQVLWDLYNKYKPAEFAQVKVLTMFTTAPANIMSKKPIRTLEDIKGLNLRASGFAVQILKAWGANPVGMPMSSTPEALQKGVVDGLFTSVEVMKDFKFAELCKSITMTQADVYPFAVVMNKAKWDALPDDVKKVFDDMAAEQCVWTGEYMDGHIKEAVEWSKKEQKVEVIELSAEQKAKWNAMLAPNIEEWLKQAKDAKLPADEILADIRVLIKKYSAEPEIK